MIYSENILICITAPLLIAAIFLRGESRRFSVFFAVGMFICLLSAYISGFLEYAGVMDAKDIPLYLSPVVEESMKLLPLIFVLQVIQPPEDSLFLGAVALGTGFATFENCCYILTAGAENLAYILVRGLAVGVMHLVCVLMVILGPSWPEGLKPFPRQPLSAHCLRPCVIILCIIFWSPSRE